MLLDKHLGDLLNDAFENPTFGGQRLPLAYFKQFYGTFIDDIEALTLLLDQAWVCVSSAELDHVHDGLKLLDWADEVFEPEYFVLEKVKCKAIGYYKLGLYKDALLEICSSAVSYISVCCPHDAEDFICFAELLERQVQNDFRAEALEDDLLARGVLFSTIGYIGIVAARCFM